MESLHQPERKPQPESAREPDKGFVERGEEALADVAQGLLENPVFNQALVAALGAGERALNAQRQAIGALNLPSATDIDRLERRIRGLSERLEAVEDRLDRIAADVVELAKEVGSSGSSGEVSSGQARFPVPERD